MGKSVSALVALVLLALAACQAPIESEATLGEPDAAAIDPRLAGLWYGDDASDGDVFRVFVFVSPRPGTPYLDVLAGYADPSGSDAPDWSRLGWFRATVTATTLDGATFYAAARTPGVGFDYTPAGVAPGDILFRAEFDAAGDLTLAGLAEAVLAQHGVTVAKSAIAGDDTYRRIALSRADLVALVREIGPDALFAERWGPLRKADAAGPFTLEGLPEP